MILSEGLSAESLVRVFGLLILRRNSSTHSLVQMDELVTFKICCLAGFDLSTNIGGGCGHSLHSERTRCQTALECSANSEEGKREEPEMTAEELRRQKRRKINRESARRMRLKPRTEVEEQKTLISTSPPASTLLACVCTSTISSDHVCLVLHHSSDTILLALLSQAYPCSLQHVQVLLGQLALLQDAHRRLLDDYNLLRQQVYNISEPLPRQ